MRMELGYVQRRSSLLTNLPVSLHRYTCPFVERFSLEIETKYFDDAGDKDNVFELTGSEIRNRQVGKLRVRSEPRKTAYYGHIHAVRCKITKRV